jgi:large subunit ribosomal protein L37Ae
MAQRTKKVKSVGRFGARYGVSIRRKVREVEAKQRLYHPCPGCGALKVKRVSTSIWQCRKCDYKFAGGAYMPDTPSGKIVFRTIRDILEGRKPLAIVEKEATGQ